MQTRYKISGPQTIKIPGLTDHRVFPGLLQRSRGLSPIYSESRFMEGLREVRSREGTLPNASVDVGCVVAALSDTVAKLCFSSI